MQQISPLLQARIEQRQLAKPKAPSPDLSEKPDTVELSSKKPVNKKINAKAVLGITAVVGIVTAAVLSIRKGKTPVQIQNMKKSAADAMKQAQILSEGIQEKAEALQIEVIKFFDNVSQNKLAKQDGDGFIVFKELTKDGKALRISSFKDNVLLSIKEIQKGSNAAECYEFNKDGSFAKFLKYCTEFKDDRIYNIEEILAFEEGKICNYKKCILGKEYSDIAAEFVHFKDGRPVSYWRGSSIIDTKGGRVCEKLDFLDEQPYKYKIRYSVPEEVETSECFSRGKNGKWEEDIG